MAESDLSPSRFSAAGPALRYLAQVDYALLAALERMDDEDDFASADGAGARRGCSSS